MRTWTEDIAQQDTKPNSAAGPYLRNAVVAGVGAAALAFTLAPKTPSEAENFSNPNTVSLYEQQGFPVPVYHETVQESDHNIGDMEKRIGIDKADWADVSSIIGGQTGKYLNIGEQVAIPAHDYEGVADTQQ